jgi:hypothetical protein
MSKGKKSTSKAKKRRTPTRKKGKTTLSTCTELVVIDDTSIRQKLQTSLKRAKTYYQKAQMEWETHQNEALPAYEEWLKRVEGALPMQVAELQRNAYRKQLILDDVENFAYDYGISKAEAFARLMDLLDHPDQYQKPGGSGKDGFGEPGGGAEDGDDWDDEPFVDDDDDDEEEEAMKEDLKMVDSVLSGKTSLSEFRAYLIMIVGMNTNAMDDQALKDYARVVRAKIRKELGLSSRSSDGSNDPQMEDEAKRLKRKYREIVKWLHPDATQAFDDHKRRLWLEVQEAYEHEDEDFLDVVLAQMRLHCDEAEAPSCWDLKSTVTFYRDALKSLRKTLTREKKSEAWQFFKMDTVERSRMGREIRQQLDNDLRSLKHMSRTVEKAYQQLEKHRKKFDVEIFRREEAERVAEPVVDEFERFEEMFFGKEPEGKGKKKKSADIDPNQDAFDFF